MFIIILRDKKQIPSQTWGVHGLCCFYSKANPEHCCHLLAKTDNSPAQWWKASQFERHKLYEIHIRGSAESMQLDMLRRFNISVKVRFHFKVWVTGTWIENALDSSRCKNLLRESCCWRNIHRESEREREAFRCLLRQHAAVPPASTRCPCADRNATDKALAPVLSRPLPKLQQPLRRAPPLPTQPDPAPPLSLPIPISPCILGGAESSCCTLWTLRRKRIQLGRTRVKAPLRSRKTVSWFIFRAHRRRTLRGAMSEMSHKPTPLPTVRPSPDDLNQLSAHTTGWVPPTGAWP